MCASAPYTTARFRDCFKDVEGLFAVTVGVADLRITAARSALRFVSKTLEELVQTARGDLLKPQHPQSRDDKAPRGAGVRLYALRLLLRWTIPTGRAALCAEPSLNGVTERRARVPFVGRVDERRRLSCEVRTDLILTRAGGAEGLEFSRPVSCSREPA